MASAVSALAWDVIARDKASATYRRVAAAADEASAATRRAAASSDSYIARMSKAGSALTKTLTLPLAAATAASVFEAAKYQKNLNAIANATDQTSKQMQASSKGLMSIATSTGTGLSQLTDGLYTVEKGGLRGAKALDTVRAAAQGAKAENADMGTVTNALTSIMASYGKQIGTPVQAMNMLIRGSGLAKTSLQDFAGSLSTVVPLAAKAGIGFDQVAGAVDTLTQHGTSAQEATQELAFLIRGLQAPSQVAQKAMSQVGLSVNKVSLTLGKKGGNGGLIGALNQVEDAVTKHLGPSGLVVVDTFKKSANATADLNTMIGSMPPGLAKFSKGLLDGSVSIKTYQQDAKALGGQAGASGLQFLSLYKSSKGFNDLLKAGSAAQRTAAAEMKDLFGGATGLNAALQLGGHSAKYFADASNSIGDAAKHAGTDVLGWSRTQGLFSTKVDQAKANLQVLAVEIGTALIPVLSKVVSGVSSVVNWFENLSSGDKKVIAWSAGIVAAIGPVLSITSRLGLASRGLASFAGASEATASRVAMSMQRIGAAVGGLALAYGGTQTHGTGGAIMGALGGGLTGAAIGSFFGPIGTAVGGVTGAVAGLAAHYLTAGNAGHSSAAKQQKAAQAARSAILAQRQAVDTLTSAIDADSNAIGRNTRAQVANDLQKSGALKAAANLNIDPGLVTKAAMGQQGAQRSLTAQINQRSAADLSSGTPIGSAQTKNLLTLSSALKAEGINLARAGKNEDLLAEADGRLNFSRRKVFDETKRYGTALDNATISGRANIKFIHDHVTALDNERKTGKLTNDQWATQIGTLQSQLKQYGFNTAGISRYISGFAHIPKSVITKLLADPKVANSAVGAVLRGIGKVPAVHNTLLNAADKATPKAQSIIATLGLIPHSKSTTITANTAGAMARLQALLAAIPKGTYHYNVVADTRNKAKSGIPLATGGIVHGPGTGTSDSAGVFALSNGEAVIPARAVSQNHGIVNALIRAGRGMASGGHVKPKTYTVDGTKYTSKTGAENAEHRLIEALAKAGVSLASVASNAKSTADQVRTAAATLISAAKKTDLSAHALSVLSKDSSRLNTLARSRDAVAARLGSPAGGTTAYDKLATAQGNYSDLKSSVSGAVTGSFDITAAPTSIYNDKAPTTSYGSIMASLKTAVMNSKSFAGVLATLRKLGLNPTLLSQLASAGPVALPEAKALASATKSQISALNGQYGSLSKYGSAAGTTAAGDLYGAGVAAAQGLVKGLLSQEKAITKAMQKIDKSLVKQIRKDLKIHSPSQVMFEHGAHTGEGFGLGIESKLDRIAQAGAAMATAASAPGGSGGGSSRGSVTNNYYNNTTVQANNVDEHVLAAVLDSRLAMAARR